MRLKDVLLNNQRNGERVMKTMKVTGILVLLFVLLTATGYSQSRFQTGIYFAMGYPQNDFKQNVDNVSYGVSGYFTYRLPRSPLSVGLSFSYLQYGLVGISNSTFIGIHIESHLIKRKQSLNYYLVSIIYLRIRSQRIR